MCYQSPRPLMMAMARSPAGKLFRASIVAVGAVLLVACPVRVNGHPIFLQLFYTSELSPTYPLLMVSTLINLNASLTNEASERPSPGRQMQPATLRSSTALRPITLVRQHGTRAS